MTKKLRQGDVLLVKIESLPSGTKDSDNILAYGEVSGHSHRINGARVYAVAEQKYVNVEQTATLEHEEHGTLQLEKGVYQVILQQEYSASGMQRVQD